MNIEEFRIYCLSLNGTSESLPFGENILVFKVMDKIFALTDILDFKSVNLKCDPEKAIELREKYTSVVPGYHMNKKHWNTIEVNADMDDLELKKWILHSYELVVSQLPKKVQAELKEISD